MEFFWSFFVLVLSCSSCANSQDLAPDSEPSGGCNCEYLEQPPTELQCDPYRNAELRLECTVVFPSTLGNKEVVWFRSQLQPQNQMRDSNVDSWSMNKLDTSSPDIQIREQRQASTTTQNAWIRSQLVLTNLNESSVGDYWCRIKADDVWFIPSDSVYLQPASGYSRFGQCSGQLAQSKQERKCAGWSTTDSLIVTSSGPELATDPSSGPELATNPSSGSSTTPSSLPTTSDSSAETPDDGFFEEDNHRSLTIELYISIAILAFFGVIVLVLVPVTLYLFISRKKQGADTKPDLEKARPGNNQRRSSTFPMVAADYLVPQPFCSISQQQLQESWASRQSFNGYNCDITHEYEDVKVSTPENNSEHIYSNLTNSSVTMTVNEAYSACDMAERLKGRVGPSIDRADHSIERGQPPAHTVVIPNPMYICTTSQGERISDDSGEYVDPSDCSYL